MEPIPEELRRFILTSVPSVPFVEALLIFRDATTPVTIEKLAKLLYVGERQAAEIVEQLRSARIIGRSEGGDGHAFAPAPEIAPLIDQLASLYRTRLVDITVIIHSRSGRMAQQFANAFKLRKE